LRYIGDLIKVYNLNEIEYGYKLDLTNFSMVEDFILKKKPDIIINTAAITDVDKCETEKDIAYRVNVEVVKHIVRVVRVIEAYFIQISTDYVFDGQKGLYKE